MKKLLLLLGLVLLVGCYEAKAQTTPPVATSMYIKTATYAITKKQVDPVTGKTVTVTVSRHGSIELAQRKIWTLPPGEYQITTPSYYVTTVACNASPGYCVDWIDTRISVVAARTTGRIMLVVPYTPTPPALTPN